MSKIAKRAQKNRVNEQIKAPKLRVLGPDGGQLGILSSSEALNLAKQKQLDLVEIVPNSDPPVVKIMDYGKFQYQQTKKLALAKKKQVKVTLKEVKFRPTTDVGDYEVKLRNLRRFLEAGNRAKVTVWFKGREMAAHQPLGRKLLERLKADLADVAKVDDFPKLEGRQMVMMFAPIK